MRLKHETNRHRQIDYCFPVTFPAGDEKFPSSSNETKQTHLFAGEGSAGVNYGLSICLSLFPHLQQLSCLDEGLQCGHDAPCLQTSAPQPFLQQAHVVAETRRANTRAFNNIKTNIGAT